MIRLYDAQRRSVVEVRPEGAGPLRLYACGRTLAAVLTADLVRRAFEYRGVEVRHVHHLGGAAGEADERGAESLLERAGSLAVRPASVHPRTRDHMPQIIELIAKLLGRRVAYEAGGSVLFDVAAAGYGGPSESGAAAMRAGEASVTAEPPKRRPADFFLWRGADGPDDAGFASPWGRGRPGPDVACAAIAIAHLGDTIDVGAGDESDALHHENQAAVIEAALGRRIVRHWAQSAGHGIDPGCAGDSDVLACRLVFLETHYRAPRRNTPDAIAAAERTLQRWRRLVQGWVAGERRGGAAAAAYERQFAAAMDDDLDTPAMLALVGEVAAAPGLPRGDRADLLLRWDAFLGLDLGRLAGKERTIPAMAVELIAQREKARLRNDWSTADRLRHKILALGVEVEDTAEGPKARLRGR